MRKRMGLIVAQYNNQTESERGSRKDVEDTKVSNHLSVLFSRACSIVVLTLYSFLMSFV